MSKNKTKKKHTHTHTQKTLKKPANKNEKNVGRTFSRTAEEISITESTRYSSRRIYLAGPLSKNKNKTQRREKSEMPFSNLKDRKAVHPDGMTAETITEENNASTTRKRYC